MVYLLLIFTSVVCTILAKNHTDSDKLILGQFPDEFAFGVATSAYQVEGAWNEDGKGKSIWDVFSHTPGKTVNGETGDVSIDQYHKYKEDIQNIKWLGVTHYRFSIAWTRLLPDGTTNNVSQKGIDHYNDVINELLKYNITPFVTLYHWDLPQGLQDHGGWASDTVIQHFANYADLCFKSFGDRVKNWITFNEPFITSWMGHENGEMAPGIKDSAVMYKVAHNLIRSHVEAYYLYNKTYKHVQKGQVGITLDSEWKEPVTDSERNQAAAQRALTFRIGWFADPLIFGDYPDLMKVMIALKSNAQGRTTSKLPQFTQTEITRNKGTVDFFGINHYSTNIVEHQNIDNTINGFFNEQNVKKCGVLNPICSKYVMFRNYAWGLRKLMNYMKKTYGHINIYVTENGLAECGTTWDQQRIDYIKYYTNNLLEAINDGCPIKGYFLWSYSDSYEWNSGYGVKMGLFYVDFTQPELPRFPKASAYFYQKLCKAKGFTQEILDFRVSK
ncbi:hypothetical protein LOTGIDRAFT_131894 [Lottia gigantea]|uniref:Cytosolic beta-glucosidase n=1 Tax=Lottia gigantea TaxID=225164 RepID=V4B7R1_LOTGI|nr:hypothetical protein LOTGIDRAFT_131894 [Lottia gigantea]ESO84674.1 hypothetical protein LOTGIDRAFT_131894 [Lottia gigantea]